MPLSEVERLPLASRSRSTCCLVSFRTQKMPTLDELLDRAGGRAGGRADLNDAVKAVRAERDGR